MSNNTTITKEISNNIKSEDGETIVVKNYNASTVADMAHSEQTSLVNALNIFSHNTEQRSNLSVAVTALHSASSSEEEQKATDNLTTLLEDIGLLSPKATAVIVQSIAQNDPDKTKFLLGDISYQAAW
jgi:hypothetical protein